MNKFLAALALTTLLPAASALAQSTIYPLTIENAGNTLVFDKAPEHPVSLNGHTTETMLALGLADRMVGTAYVNHPILEALKADYDRIPSLSGDNAYPSTEVLVGSGADFTYGRLSANSDTALGPAARLGDLGIKAYVVQGTTMTGATVDDVYADIENLGRIFDIQPRANALIEDMKTRLAEVTAVTAKASEPVTVLVFDSGTDTIFTAGKALETNLISLAGGINVFADLAENWTDVSWEEAVARNPDVIVINDYGATPAADKIALLKGNPALATISAIKNDRFVVVPLPGTFESIRIPDTVHALAAAFYPDLF